jgi:hypothetical protein
MRVAASLITLLLVSAVVSAKKKKQKKENLFREEQQILSQKIEELSLPKLALLTYSRSNLGPELLLA